MLPISRWMVALALTSACGGEKDESNGAADSAEGSEQEPLFVDCTVQCDLDVDMDEESDIIYRDVYDERGDLARMEEENPPPELDEVIWYTYDEEHRILTMERDDEADGSLDQAAVWVYDGDFLDWIEVDEDGDGDLDSTYDHIQDESGNTVEVHRLDPSGELIGRVESDYDGDLRVEMRYDEDADGSFDRYEYWEYDASGWVIAYDLDEEGDGDLDNRKTYTRTESGDTATCDEDEDGDGAVDGRFTYTYRQPGELERTEYDEGLDGVIDELFTCEPCE